MKVNKKVFQPLSSFPSILKSTHSVSRYFSFVLVLTILFSISVFRGITAYAAPQDQKVYDNYGLFTEEEIASLEATCKEYGEEGKVDIVIATTDGQDGRTRTQYINDFYDEYGLGYEKEFGTAAVILIDMNSNDRGVEIRGFGNAETYISSSRIELILDDIVPMLSDGNYFEASVEYSKQVAKYMNDKGIFYNTLFQLAISLVIGAIVVAVMALQSGGKVTINNRTYLDEQNSKVVASQDKYTRTTTTRVKKPSNNSGGGSSVSKGGHSSSGGGRSF